MTISNTIPAPIPNLSPKLMTLLQGRTDDVLAYLISTNSGTTYFREASLLSDFRTALRHESFIQGETSKVEHGSPCSEVPLHPFTTTVPLTTYEDYRPYVSRFMESPRCLSDVSNLLAPDVPAFVVSSSGTSGGVSKYFLKYRHPPSTSSSAIKAMKAFSPAFTSTGGTHCIIYNLRYSDLFEVTSDDSPESRVVNRVPLCLGSSVAFRTFHRWDVEHDSALMTTKAPNATSPLAICFIHPYRTSMLMHALFALEDRSLEMINTLFCTFFVDFVRLIEQHWDMLIQAIEDGVIPQLDGAEHVHQYLQGQFQPNPARAAELRAVGNDTASPGWVKRLWPELQRVLGNASGPFSRLIRQVRHYTGPSVSFQSVGLTCSETWLAQIYDPQRDLNLYKMSSDDLFEYLDVPATESAAHLKQAWETETGKDYELVLTTRDGLWRYRLGDVVEIAGYDPMDGQPIIRYSRRRNMMMRASAEFVTEKELVDAVHSLSDILGNVAEFTVMIDDRPVPRAYGFLVELEGRPGPNAKSGPSHLNDFLKSRNDTFAYFSSRQLLGIPRFRRLAPGTFRSYREWKASKNANGGGQIKVPTIVSDEEVVDWLLNRVMEEI
ncbi:GH3 auxin-responsive promoter [Lyophyllum atratum]|nr:GH3 auxin-responsive promoter [Lyophyllum atratum]